MLMLSAANRTASDYVMHHMMFYRLEEGLEEIPYKNVTIEEGGQIAEHLIEDLGLGNENWTLAYSADLSAEDEAVRQRFVYTPAYFDIPVIYGPTVDVKSEELYAANYQYTSLEINLYNGMIDSVWLFSPVDILNIENEDVAVILLKRHAIDLRHWHRLLIRQTSGLILKIPRLTMFRRVLKQRRYVRGCSE